MEDDIRNKVKEIINNPNLKISDTDPLISSGLLSSMKVMALATWIEKKFGLDFEKNGFNVYDFESIQSIIDLIKKSHEAS